MSTTGATLRAYAELARVSNLPTCLSNVLVGCAIGGRRDQITWTAVAGMTAAIMLFYVAGMALNDAIDHGLDQRIRPERPIPSGRVSRAGALGFAAACMAGGLGLTAGFGGPALGLGLILAATIIAYDLLHHRLAGSVVLMGVCRGLVYLVAAAAVAWPLDWPVAALLAGAMTVYVILLTVVAQVEAGPEAGPRRWLALALPLVALAPAGILWPGAGTRVWPFAAAAVVAAWLLGAARHVLARPGRIRRAVLGWLAGICLVDAFYLTLLDRGELALVAAGCFALTALGHRYILGT